MKRRARILAACAPCLLLDGVAFAAEPAPPGSPAAEASVSGEDPAAAAFQRALAAYAARDLAGALSAMRESLRLSGRAELLYNIARIEDEAGDCADALADYREYLSRVPDGRYRTEAERASQALSERCPAPETATAAALPGNVTPLIAAPSSAQSPPEAPPRPPSAAEEQSRWPPSALGYGALALGVLAGASSIYFTSRALEARDDFQASVDDELAGGPYADWSLQDEQHRSQTWAQVLALSGGALIAGGVVVLVLAPRKSSSTAPSTQFRLAPSHVSLSHSF